MTTASEGDQVGISRKVTTGAVLAAILLATTVSAGPGSAASPVDRPTSEPIVGHAEAYALSRPARDLSPSGPQAAAGAVPTPRISSGEPEAGPLASAAGDRREVPIDPLIPVSQNPDGTTPSPDLVFPGQSAPRGCIGCAPPDPIGDVGPDHYIQMVNLTLVAIYDKTGTPLQRPFDLAELWPGGPCANSSFGGDPVVVYDEMADRWLLSQLAYPSYLCFAISQTGDPQGSYHLYTFDVVAFPDYFKVGVGRDAYYVGALQRAYTAMAFDRERMLAGDRGATFIRWIGETNFLMPADIDGPTPPDGSPGYFYTFKDDNFHGGDDRIDLFGMRPNFAHPFETTFDLVESFPVAEFTYTVCGHYVFDCVRQPDTTQGLDVVSEWPMYRFAYRRAGARQSLVGNWTVGGGTGEVGAAIRWFELRNTGAGWVLHQEGTQDPGDGHDRFMGSIAMDRAGNIALGYSVSSSTLFPSIRYAVRAPRDPLGTLREEAVLVDGDGSQTASSRWGDYSAMVVDPADDCTFWYTNEFYEETAPTAWDTAIGTFVMPGCTRAR